MPQLLPTLLILSLIFSPFAAFGEEIPVPVPDPIPIEVYIHHTDDIVLGVLAISPYDDSTTLFVYVPLVYVFVPDTTNATAPTSYQYDGLYRLTRASTTDENGRKRKTGISTVDF